MRMLKWIGAAAFAVIFTAPVFAVNNRYFRDGASGSTCADWGANACDQYTDSVMSRGDTAYFAGGSYSILTLGKAESGSTVITLKPATVADHGTSTGWSDSYATQPSINGVDYHAGYYTIDGGTRNSSDWNDGTAYGFKFSNATNVFYANYPNNSICPDHEIIQYVDMGGADIGNVYAVNPAGINVLGDDSLGTCDTWSINHNRIHNVQLPIAIRSATNFTIEYNLIINAWSKEAIRGSTISSGHTIRYNYMQDACQFTPGDGTSTCDGEIGMWDGSVAGSYDNIAIYGNIIRVTTSEQHTGGCMFVGGGNAYPGVNGNNISIYNNACTGIKSSLANITINGGVGGGGSGNLCKNNLWYDDTGTPICDVGGGSQSNNSEVGSDPFVSYSTGNFHLSANTATGATLSSPYDMDMDGVTRGGPAAWSLGALQFVPSSCTPSKLLWDTQPASAQQGVTLGSLQVGVYDSGSVKCTSDTSTVTIAKKGGTCTGMTLNGTVSGSAVAGTFTTTDVNLTVGTGSCTLTATDGILTSADSNSFTISAANTYNAAARGRVRR